VRCGGIGGEGEGDKLLVKTRQVTLCRSDEVTENSSAHAQTRFQDLRGGGVS